MISSTSLCSDATLPRTTLRLGRVVGGGSGGGGDTGPGRLRGADVDLLPGKKGLPRPPFFAGIPSEPEGHLQRLNLDICHFDRFRLVWPSPSEPSESSELSLLSSVLSPTRCFGFGFGFGFNVVVVLPDSALDDDSVVVLRFLPPLPPSDTELLLEACVTSSVPFDGFVVVVVVALSSDVSLSWPGSR